jgi:hypothetical protein
MSDPVNKPVHYNVGGIEAIEAIMAATNEQAEGYLQGNIMKYIWRYRYKNGFKGKTFREALIEIGDLDSELYDEMDKDTMASILTLKFIQGRKDYTKMMEAISTQ